MNIGGYSNNPFSAGSSSNSLNSLFAGASYYKLASQYAIKQKYAHAASQHASKNNTSSANQTSSAKPNKAPSTSKEATKFLTDHTSNYDSLKSATKELKTKINDENASTESKVSAVKDYVKAYNNTLAHLQEHSGEHTYALNRLKGSLEAISLINGSITAGIGLSKNNDGTLSVDTDKLTKAFTNNAAGVKRNLSSLASITEAHNSMASNTPNAKLLKEQNLMAVNKPTNKPENDIAYDDFMAMANNSLALKNFYFGLACSGTFMDISI